MLFERGCSPSLDVRQPSVPQLPLRSGLNYEEIECMPRILYKIAGDVIVVGRIMLNG